MIDNNILNIGKNNNDLLQLPQRKTVKFNPSLRVVLIPSRGEFKQVGLQSVLWWNSCDYINFQNNANSEIRMLVSFENITAKQARKKLYQSSDIVDNDEISNYNLINTNPSPSNGQQSKFNYDKDENLSPNNNNEKTKIIIKKNIKKLERQDSLQNISEKSHLIKSQLNKSNNGGSNNENNNPNNKRDDLTLSVPLIEKMMVNFDSRSRTKKNNSSSTFYILGTIVLLAAVYWY